MTFRKQTNSPDETWNLGRTLGRLIQPGMVIALTGTLGSGKTAFTQGLAQGVGVDERWYVTSPSYTLINEYPVKQAKTSVSPTMMYHIDLYRLGAVEDLDDLGLDEIFDGNHLVVIEWADKFGPIPEPNQETARWGESLVVNFEITGETGREINCVACDAHGEAVLAALT